MIHYKKFLNACAPLLMLFSMSAFAQTQYSAGRSVLTLPSSSWKELKLEDAGVQYGGDLTGKLSSDNKIFIQTSPAGTVDTILWVRASSNALAGGYFSYSPKCEDKNAVSAEGNKGFQQSFYKCLVIYPLFTSASLIKGLGDPSAEALKSYMKDMPQGMRMISAHYAGSTGSFLQVRAIFSPEFSGVPDPGAGTDPYLAWGRLLINQLQGSVTSMSGHWTIPSIQYRPRPSEGEKRVGILGLPTAIQ